MKRFKNILYHADGAAGQGMGTVGRTGIPGPIIGSTAENVLQEVVLVWKTDDPYTGELMERVLNSVELIKPEGE